MGATNPNAQCACARVTVLLHIATRPSSRHTNRPTNKPDVSASAIIFRPNVGLCACAHRIPDRDACCANRSSSGGHQFTPVLRNMNAYERTRQRCSPHNHERVCASVCMCNSIYTHAHSQAQAARYLAITYYYQTTITSSTHARTHTDTHVS